MSRAKIVDFYLEKLSDPNFTIDQVRQDLEKHNFEEAEIKVVVRLVDNELQRRLHHQTHQSTVNKLAIFGGVITALGLFITIGTYTGLLNTGRSYVIAYGPILGGASILFAALARRRK